MPKPTIVIANDHAATDLKKAIIQAFDEYAWKDLGTTETDSVDYPDYAAAASKAVQDGSASRAILICGSGVGMCISANKFDGIRAALAESVEVAQLSREHNDANVLCLGARNLRQDLAFEIIRTWLNTPFSEAPRHLARIRKIAHLEVENRKADHR